MARLHDLLISRDRGFRFTGLAQACYPDPDAIADTLRGLARDGVAVAADDVCDFFYANDYLHRLGKSDSDAPLDYEAFSNALPNLAPPFPVTLIQMRRSALFATKAAGLMDFAPQEWGVLCGSATVDALQPYQDLPGMGVVSALPGAHWIMQATIIGREGDDLLMTGLTYTLVIGTDGRLVESPRVPPALVEHLLELDARAVGVTVPPSIYFQTLGLALLMPCLLAITFMHCKKGVRLADVAPEPRLNRARARRGKPPLVTYKTLIIDGISEALRREGDIKANGLAKALHLCRGHFATYTPEKGFLGRPLAEPLTIFRPAHLRGRASEGTVIKDYDVKPGGPPCSP